MLLEEDFDALPVTIKLAPVLPTTVAVAQFPNVRAATEAVGEILNAGVGIRKYKFIVSGRSLTVRAQNVSSW